MLKKHIFNIHYIIKNSSLFVQNVKKLQKRIVYIDKYIYYM